MTKTEVSWGGERCAIVGLAVHGGAHAVGDVVCYVCVCVVACAVPAGKILCSTIQENADMMKGLLDVVPQAFMPSIPHLVYQYSMYANYPTTHMAKKNPEIPDDD